MSLLFGAFSWFRGTLLGRVTALIGAVILAALLIGLRDRRLKTAERDRVVRKIAHEDAIRALRIRSDIADAPRRVPRTTAGYRD